MTPQDVQRIAVAQEHEQGYRVGFALFGAGENSDNAAVRLGAVRAVVVAAVGQPLPDGQLTMDVAA